MSDQVRAKFRCINFTQHAGHGDATGGREYTFDAVCADDSRFDSGARYRGSTRSVGSSSDRGTLGIVPDPADRRPALDGAGNFRKALNHNRIHAIAASDRVPREFPGRRP